MTKYVEDLNREYKMESKGKEPIWFTGTQRTIWRTLYKSDCKYFCKWYGRMIEVQRGRWGFVTVEQY